MKHYRKLEMSFIFFFLLCISTTTFGQKNKDLLQYFIKGNVFDSSTKNGIPYSSVYINNNIVTTTDKYGSFTLSIPNKYIKKDFTVFVSCVEYFTKKIAVRNKESALTENISTSLTKDTSGMNKKVIIR